MASEISPERLSRHPIIATTIGVVVGLIVFSCVVIPIAIMLKVTQFFHWPQGGQ